MLTLCCSSPGAQSCREAYKPSSSEGMVLYLFYVSGIPLLYFKVGSPIYIVLLLAYVACLPWLTFCPCQSTGPAPSVGSGGGPLGQFSWAMGLRAPVPSSVGRDGLSARSGLGGCRVVCPSIRPPHVLPWADSDRRVARLLTGST